MSRHPEDLMLLHQLKDIFGTSVFSIPTYTIMDSDGVPVSFQPASLPWFPRSRPEKRSSPIRCIAGARPPAAEMRVFNRKRAHWTPLMHVEMQLHHPIVGRVLEHEGCMKKGPHQPWCSPGTAAPERFLESQHKPPRSWPPVFLQRLHTCIQPIWKFYRRFDHLTHNAYHRTTRNSGLRDYGSCITSRLRPAGQRRPSSHQRLAQTQPYAPQGAYSYLQGNMQLPIASHTRELAHRE